MLKKRVMPCLLLRNKGLVKTVKFKNPVYVGDPMNAVKIFNEKEADELIFLDIDATGQGRGPDLATVTRISEEAFMPLTVGGGVRAVQGIRDLLNAGADKVAINSAVADNPALVKQAAEVFGCQCIVASIDVRRRWTGKYEVCVRNASRRTGRDPVEFAQEMESLGAGEVLLNAVDRDGTMEGYDLGLLRAVTRAVKVPVIACGGAGSVADFARAFQEGAAAAAAGSLFVFHGPRRAVLISFPTPGERDLANAA